jgi:hypothetical protein
MGLGAAMANDMIEWGRQLPMIWWWGDFAHDATIK